MIPPDTKNDALDGVARVRTVDRALDVLFCLADTRAPTGLNEISRRTGLDKATAYRLLRALAARDLVRAAEQPGHYVLGLGVLRLSAAVLGGVDIRSIARPFMRELRDQAGETVALCALAGDRRVYIDQIESPQSIRWTVRIGQSVPLYSGSGAKAILAYLPEAEREAILARTEFIPLTPETPKSAEALRLQIAEVRRTGVAVAIGEREPGAAAVAAAIFDHTGRPIGALTICGPRERFDLAAIERCREPLLAATKAISVQFGYRDRGDHHAHE